MTIPAIVLLIAAATQAPVVLACNIPALGGPRATAAAAAPDRLFRLAPGSLQEWNPARKAFGANRCAAYTCVRTAGRTEGTIGSASVVYTVGVAGGVGYWRVIGASGGGAKSGSCRIVTGPAP